MSELEQILVGDAYAASPAHILEGLSEELVHRKPPGAPHSIYEELWHIVFWQQVTLDWINGIETPFPASPADGVSHGSGYGAGILDAALRAVLSRGERGRSRYVRRRPAEPDGALSVAAGTARAGNDGARAGGEHGCAQRLSPGAFCAPAAIAERLASQVWRIHVVAASLRLSLTYARWRRAHRAVGPHAVGL